MFERFFGKKNTDKLIDSIAHKTSEKIAVTISDKSDLNPASVAVSLEIKKKELEVALLELDKQKREQEATKTEIKHEKMDAEKEAALKKTSWHKLTSFFIREREFNVLQAQCKINASPQEIQGLVQAVGQVRAARITALGAIIATGVGGIGLWIFQQTVSSQKKQADEKDAMLKHKETVINARETLLNEFQENYSEATKSINVLENEAIEVDKFVKGLCENKKDCLEGYTSSKEKGREYGLYKYNKAIASITQHDLKTESQSPSLKNRQ